MEVCRHQPARIVPQHLLVPNVSCSRAEWEQLTSVRGMLGAEIVDRVSSVSDEMDELECECMTLDD
jgi:hypothetical protein